jgi:TATA-box binding protein (TBP) (component of TFIID and TFIIIB)
MAQSVRQLRADQAAQVRPPVAARPTISVETVVSSATLRLEVRRTAIALTIQGVHKVFSGLIEVPGYRNCNSAKLNLWSRRSWICY